MREFKNGSCVSGEADQSAMFTLVSPTQQSLNHQRVPTVEQDYGSGTTKMVRGCYGVKALKVREFPVPCKSAIFFFFKKNKWLVNMFVIRASIGPLSIFHLCLKLNARYFEFVKMSIVVGVK